MLYPNFKTSLVFLQIMQKLAYKPTLEKVKPDPDTIFGVPLMKEFILRILHDELPNNHLTDFTELPETDLWVI